MESIVELDKQMRAKRQSQKRAYENRKVRLRENYRYAREKGFSASDAQILSFRSKEDIDRLAQLRGA